MGRWVKPVKEAKQVEEAKPGNKYKLNKNSYNGKTHKTMEGWKFRLGIIIFNRPGVAGAVL